MLGKSLVFRAIAYDGNLVCLRVIPMSGKLQSLFSRQILLVLGEIWLASNPELTITQVKVER